MPHNIISVIGLGYIGLPTAATLASKEKKVIGVDVSQKVVDIINSGQVHIKEPELDFMVKNAVKKGFLTASIEPQPADVFMIAVPTPFYPITTKDSVPEPDLSFIKDAAISIASVLKKGDLVILESTSPVGTTEQLSKWLSEARSDLTFPHLNGEDSDIRIAYCPERVLPGNITKELIDNDRIIGGITDCCSMAAKKLYEEFVKGNCILTNDRTAEMSKLTENAFRDVGIAFANELSVICDEQNINVWELISLANHHPRVNILQPGPGVGGHCIAVDPWFIVDKSPNLSRLIKTARQINDAKPDFIFSKLKSVIKQLIQEGKFESISQITIACYGVTFKPNIDDTRQSPALGICEKIIETHPGPILIVEPNLDNDYFKQYGLKLFSDIDNLPDADIHLLLVPHKQFSDFKPESGIIIDACGVWE